MGLQQPNKASIKIRLNKYIKYIYIILLAFGMTGCGGITKNNMNPNPSLAFSKEGEHICGEGFAKIPKGAKGATEKK